MKKILSFVVISFLFTACSAQKETLVEDNFKVAEHQYSQMLQKNPDSTKTPRTTTPDGKFKAVDIKEWTSGFFAGSLWYIYESSRDDKWLKEAKKWTAALKQLEHFNEHHDVGFMLYCSYGNGLRLTKNPEYKSVLLNGAEALLTRYSPVVKSIQSWNPKKSWDGKTMWNFPVIIDNMMNLELLFWASKESGDKKYYDIAVEHARTTMKYHYRPDYSCYHVVNYDPKTGVPLNKQTSQGFADESSWSRGQAWGLYGFTLCYRETGLKEFLDMAENIGAYLMNHPNLPEDAIPYWDYNVNQPGFTPQWNYDPAKFPEIPRDVSAASIMASAFYELSTYVKDGKKYSDFADRIVTSLSSTKYLANAGENNNFLLMHSVGSIPHNSEIDKPLVYADYYFLEALLRKEKLEKGEILFNK